MAKFYIEDCEGWLWTITTEDYITWKGFIPNDEFLGEENGYEGSLHQVLLNACVMFNSEFVKENKNGDNR